MERPPPPPMPPIAGERPPLHPQPVLPLPVLPPPPFQVPRDRFPFPPSGPYPPHPSAYPPPRGFYQPVPFFNRPYYNPRHRGGRGGPGRGQYGRGKRHRAWADTGAAQEPGSYKKHRDDGRGGDHAIESLYSQSMFEDPWKQLMTEDEVRSHEEQLADHIRERLGITIQDSDADSRQLPLTKEVQDCCSSSTAEGVVLSDDDPKCGSDVEATSSMDNPIPIPAQESDPLDNNTPRTDGFPDTSGKETT